MTSDGTIEDKIRRAEEPHSYHEPEVFPGRVDSR